MATFPDVDVKDFTSGLLKTVKGFDLGSSKLALAHMLVDTNGAALVKAEDAASASGDGLLPIAVVQLATPANNAADGDYVTLQMNLGHLWVAAPPLAKVSANFNRPGDTTGYSVNDTVADNTTAGSVTKLSWSIPRSNGNIRRVKIRKSNESVATPTLRLWLWDATFTVGAGDNAAFANPLQDTLGYVDVAVVNAGSDDAVGWTNCDIPFSAGTVFGLLQTLSAFTPANAETFTVVLSYLPG